MGFVIVARQFIGGRARAMSDGLEGKNFRRRKVNLRLTADWTPLSEHPLVGGGCSEIEPSEGTNLSVSLIPPTCRTTYLPTCPSPDLPRCSARQKPRPPETFSPSLERLGDFREVGGSRPKVACFCGLCQRCPPIHWQAIRDIERRRGEGKDIFVSQNFCRHGRKR